jgi:hypothetical protein
MVSRRVKALQAQQKKMGEGIRKGRGYDLGATADSSLFLSDGTVTDLGSLAARSSITTADISANSITLKSTTWGGIAASGSEQILTYSSVSGLTYNDSILVLVSGNSPGSGITYKLYRKQDFDYELSQSFYLASTNICSMHKLIVLSDTYQPMIVNELDTTTNCNLYGGGSGDSFTGIAQIFKTTAGMAGKALSAVEFYVGFTGTAGILYCTPYLYDSDGSTVGVNLLSTGTILADDKNPVAFNGVEGWVRFVFPTPYTLAGTTSYCIVVDRSARDASNYWNFYEGPALADSAALKRSSATWGAPTGIADFAFKLFCDQSTSDWTMKLTGATDSGSIRATLDLITFRR